MHNSNQAMGKHEGSNKFDDEDEWEEDNNKITNKIKI